MRIFCCGKRRWEGTTLRYTCEAQDHGLQGCWAMVKLRAGKSNERTAEELNFNHLRAELAELGPYVVLQRMAGCVWLGCEMGAWVEVGLGAGGA